MRVKARFLTLTADGEPGLMTLTIDLDDVRAFDLSARSLVIFRKWQAEQSKKRHRRGSPERVSNSRLLAATKEYDELCRLATLIREWCQPR